MQLMRLCGVVKDRFTPWPFVITQIGTGRPMILYETASLVRRFLISFLSWSAVFAVLAEVLCGLSLVDFGDYNKHKTETHYRL